MTAMKHIIGVGDMGFSNVKGDVMITHALGSCLGIAVHDPRTGIGGLLHAMLPTSTINPEKAEANPSMFVNTGVPTLLRKVLAAGAAKERLSIKVAGGSTKHKTGSDCFEIGKRNYIMLRKVLWQFGLLVESEEIGGELPRTMYLEIGSGRVWLTSMGRKIDL
jgi:chemotaxis protein CheD